MPIHRHDGAGWAGPAKATYVLFTNEVQDAPQIWLRARTVWVRTPGGWQPATAGTAEAADCTAVAEPEQRYTSKPGDLYDPDWNPSPYSVRILRVTALNTACTAFAFWRRRPRDEHPRWEFMGAHNLHNGAWEGRVENIEMETPDEWIVTAWSGSVPAGDSFPVGQQGFSRYLTG